MCPDRWRISARMLLFFPVLQSVSTIIFVTPDRYEFFRRMFIPEGGTIDNVGVWALLFAGGAFSSNSCFPPLLFVH
jgi:hypothetical protein